MTSPSPLERLAGPGNVLAKEPPDAKEFAGLVRSGLARLKDAENEANSLDSRFDLAYSAAHALCLAALRHHGFRPSKRYIVFQVLPDTLGLGPEVWRVLSKCHDMRNRTEYEGVLDVDDRLVSDLIGACRKVADKVRQSAADSWRNRSSSHRYGMNDRLFQRVIGRRPIRCDRSSDSCCRIAMMPINISRTVRLEVLAHAVATQAVDTDRAKRLWRICGGCATNEPLASFEIIRSEDPPEWHFVEPIAWRRTLFPGLSRHCRRQRVQLSPSRAGAQCSTEFMHILRSSATLPA